MLPSRDELERLPSELLRELMALTLNPASLAVIARLVEYGIFELLAGGQGRRPPELCAEAMVRVNVETVEAAEVAVEMALELGERLGLLDLCEGHLHSSELAETFFSSSSSLRLLGHVEHYASYLGSAGSIHDAFGHTRRSRRSMWTTGAGRKAHARYFAARQPYNESRRAYFWDTSYLLMRAHLRRDLSGHRRACDVGAGPAGFAGLLARCVPGLEVHAVDASLAHEDYRRRTAEALAAEGVDVQLWGLNALHDPLPEGLDLITFNRLLSGVPRDGIEVWLERAYLSLEPGGVLAATDFMMLGDPVHDGIVARVVAQWMGKDRHLLMNNPPTNPDDDKHQWGWSRPWHADELGEAMRRSGFRDVGIRAADPPFSLVFATRA